MAGGWTRDGAVGEQIEADIADALARMRARQIARPAAGPLTCDECEDPIPQARRDAMPGVRLCVPCASGRARTAPQSTFNRRGSKDSQLR